MATTAQSYRYVLPRKAIKVDCPGCGPKHRKTLSQYVDHQTGQPLPLPYGRCDRESNCGYCLSPYHKGPSGLSYADEVKADSNLPRQWFKWAAKWKRTGSSQQGVAMTLQTMEGATPKQAEQVANYVFSEASLPSLASPANASVHCIPDEVFTASLSYYERNQFARLLHQHFGPEIAHDLLHRFQIGTSSRWPGACVFWYIDEHSRKRGGQIKLFGNDWHTVKYTDRQGETRSKTSWVHAALSYRLQQAGKPLPEWLVEYDQKADRSPCLFGLPQLAIAPPDRPIAIVEAPKTAVICSAYLPDFVWLAVGSKSYLKAERLMAVRHRRIMLYPDLGAYHDTNNKEGRTIKGWLRVASELRAAGFTIDVSNYLEQRATDEQKFQGLDLADYLLQQPPPLAPVSRQPTRPNNTWLLDGELIHGEVIAVDSDQDCPPDWDAHTDQPTPQLLVSPNRAAFAHHVGMTPNQLPLYRLTNYV